MLEHGDMIEYRAMYSHMITYTVLSFFKKDGVDMVRLLDDCGKMRDIPVKDIMNMKEYRIYRPVAKTPIVD